MLLQELELGDRGRGWQGALGLVVELEEQMQRQHRLGAPMEGQRLRRDCGVQVAVVVGEECYRLPNPPLCSWTGFWQGLPIGQTPNFYDATNPSRHPSPNGNPWLRAGGLRLRLRRPPGHLWLLLTASSST